MNNKFFLIVSIIAFVSLSYIAFDKLAYIVGGNNQYAVVMTASSTVSTSSILPTGFCFNKNLSPYKSDSDIKYLQVFLNSQGFIATLSGSENNYYGMETVLALVSFQEHYSSDILTPAGLIVGTGNFGTSTRKKINDIIGCGIIPEVATTTAIQISSSTNKYRLPPESPINYTDNKNGTIIDNYTGLIWKKCPQGLFGNDCKSGSPSLRIWSEARVECENLNFAGKNGWRIPNLKELQSIVDTGAFDPSINKKFFMGSGDPYWTLTSPAEYPASKFTVLFSDGSVYYSDMNNSAATRCVYDGDVK